MLTYKFKKSQTNYIKALAKYLKDVRIESIESDAGVLNVEKKNHKLAQLPELLTRFSDDEELTFVCSDYHAADHVLPAFDRSRLQRDVGAVTFEELEAAKASLGIIKRYFEHETFKGAKALVHFDGLIKKFKESHQGLSKKQAMLLINEIAGAYPVSTAILLPKQETVLFKLDQQFYYIRFGANAGFNMVKNFVFDLDEGFIAGQDRFNEEKHLEFKFIIDALNDHFSPWQALNYEGDMLSVRDAGLAELNPSRAMTATARTSAGGMFGLSPAPQPQPQPSVDTDEHPWCPPGTKL